MEYYILRDAQDWEVDAFSGSSSSAHSTNSLIHKMHAHSCGRVFEEKGFPKGNCLCLDGWFLGEDPHFIQLKKMLNHCHGLVLHVQKVYRESILIIYYFTRECHELMGKKSLQG